MDYKLYCATQELHRVTELEKLTDPCSTRHGGNEQSRTANKRNLLVRSDQRRQVFDLIQEMPRTMKEVAYHMGVELNRVSGRASELKLMGCVEPTGETRMGSAVLRVCGAYHD